MTFRNISLIKYYYLIRCLVNCSLTYLEYHMCYKYFASSQSINNVCKCFANLGTIYTLHFKTHAIIESFMLIYNIIHDL